MKIKRYKMKENLDISKLLEEYGKKYYIKEGGIWIKCDIKYFMCKSLYIRQGRYGFDFSINIGFPNDLSQRNDYNYITVLDEDFP